MPSLHARVTFDDAIGERLEILSGDRSAHVRREPNKAAPAKEIQVASARAGPDDPACALR